MPSAGRVVEFRLIVGEPGGIPKQRAKKRERITQSVDDPPLVLVRAPFLLAPKKGGDKCRDTPFRLPKEEGHVRQIVGWLPAMFLLLGTENLINYKSFKIIGLRNELSASTAACTAVLVT